MPPEEYREFPREKIYRLARDLRDLVEAIEGFTLRLFSESNRFHPLVDLYDRGDHYLIILSIPGVKVDSLEVQATSESVEVKGERSIDMPEGFGEPPTPEEAIVSVNIWGPFSEEIPLPTRIDPKKVEATLKNGLLYIKAQKVEGNKRKVDIE